MAFANQVFDSSGRLVRSTIETTNADASGRAIFTTCRRLARCRDGDPTWSPAGSLLAFASETRLGIAQANGSGVDRLRRRTVRDGQPAWGPDGQLLAFTGQGQPNAPVNTFILGCTSCGVRQLTFLGATDPAWSSSDRVAFTRAGNLYTVGSSERKARRLTFKGGAQPDWSPHASKLALVRRGNVYIVRRDGRGLDRITGKGATQPVWSPDGKQLAFVRRGAVYVVGADGSGLRLLAAPNAAPAAGQTVRLAAPSWQPLR